MRVLLFFFFFILPSVACATDYYMDAAVSISGNGGITSPWKKMSDIDWSLYGPGDTLYISGGPFSSSKQYNINATLNFRNAGGRAAMSDPRMMYFKIWPDSAHNGTVIIDGGDNITGKDNEGALSQGIIMDIKHADYLTIDGEVSGERHMRFQNWGAGKFKNPSAISGYGASTHLQNVIIRYIEIVNDDRVCPSPTGKPGNPEYDLFDGCMYDGTSSHPEWNNQRWNYERKNCMYLGPLGEGSILEYNYLDGCIENNIVAGIQATEFGEGPIIQDNVLRGYRNNKGRGGPDGIKGCGGATIRRNTIYHEELTDSIYNPNHVAEDGIQILSNFVDAYSNILYGYSQGPVRIDNDVAHDIRIYNNVLMSTHVGGIQRGIELDGLSGGYDKIEIVGNTITGFGSRGIHISSRDATHVDVKVYNNILYDSDLDLSISSGGDQSLVAIDYNLLIKSDRSRGNSDAVSQAHDPYNTAGTFSFVSYSVPTASTNVTGNNLHLALPSSMAISRGLSLPLPFDKDFADNPRDSTPDLGAYEIGQNGLSLPVTPRSFRRSNVTN